MTLRDRNQNPILGDTIRLKNHIMTSAAQSAVPLITKVEILRESARLEDLEFNPRGLVLKQTIVHHFANGVWNEISPFPSTSSYPEYYYLHVDTDVDDWQEGTYVDRWYLITDPLVKLENYVARAASRHASKVGSIASFSLSFSPQTGRMLTTNGMKEAADYTAMTLADIADGIDADGWPAPPVGLLDVSATTYVARVGIRNDAGVWTERLGWIRADTSNGTDFTVTVYPNTNESVYLNTVAMDGAVDSSGKWTYTFAVTTTGSTSETELNATIDGWFCEQWQITDAGYNSSIANAWDDAWDRARPNMRAISEHRFTIKGTVFFTSPRPAVYSFNYTPITQRLILGSRGYIAARITPATSVGTIDAYYRQFIDLAEVNYTIWRDRGTGVARDLVKMAEGVVDYRDGGDMFAYIDTTQSPFNQTGNYLIQYRVSWRDITSVSPRLEFVISEF